jgi:hypothetical protein
MDASQNSVLSLTGINLYSARLLCLLVLATKQTISCQVLPPCLLQIRREELGFILLCTLCRCGIDTVVKVGGHFKYLVRRPLCAEAFHACAEKMTSGARAGEG